MVKMVAVHYATNFYGKIHYLGGDLPSVDMGKGTNDICKKKSESL